MDASGGPAVVVGCCYTFQIMATASAAIPRPQPGEYNEYYERYISLIPGTDVFGTLDQQLRRTCELLTGLSDEQANLAYAPGKWTIKEVLGHITDTERIFGYRALRIARGDQTPIEGFEQDDYVRNGNFRQRRMSDLIDEYATVRAATLALFRSFDLDAWPRRGIANNKEISVRALAYLTAGHERHHHKILEEKYLPNLR